MKRMGLRNAAVVGGAVLLGALLVPGGQAVAASISQVFVTNDDAHSVPVHSVGTSTVAGTVNVGNFPAQQATRTVQLASTDLRTGPDQQVDVDVSPYQTVRLHVISYYYCNSADPGTVEVRDRATNALLDTFTFDTAYQNVNKVYEAAGTGMRITMPGSSGCTVTVHLWGRS